MKQKSMLLLFSLCFIVPQKTKAEKTEKANFNLWYEQPADEWMKAIPLGNGRMGIMVYGGVESEKVGLNEITMWSGQPDTFQEHPVGKESLNDLRQLFFKKEYEKGNQIASEMFSVPAHSFGSHVPTGDLKLDFKHSSGKVANYKRELNLHDAVTTVSYQVGNVVFTREYFCSNPDDALIIRLSANKANALNVDISMDMLRESVISAIGNSLEFSGKVSFPRQGPGGVNFLGKVGVSSEGGRVTAIDEKISVKNASSILISLDLRTDLFNKKYKEDCSKTVEKVLKQDYKNLKTRHSNDYSNLHKRVELSFGKSGLEHLPTDKRWARLRTGKEDIGMDALFFHYARYLQIASSRENSPLPTNLQGIWNDNLACNTGWTNDYHLDMNTQQNYWLSNVGNLHETNTPLFNYIEQLAVDGQKTASKVYGARGWTAHTVANVWGYTSTGYGLSWGLFPTASSWIASHLWTHYLYTQDVDFLRNKAYPILKSNAQFLLDYMVTDPVSGYLMTGPSTSPENGFLYEGKSLALSMMPACDRQLAYETFISNIEASKILGIDANFRDTLNAAIKKLPPIFVGKNGAVQEWFEDFEEAHPSHRHTSHLLALYPFAQITPDKTPDLAKAAEKTIINRLTADGWEDVEWSRANMICFYARLHNADKAYESVVQLQREFARENLLTISPEGIGGAPYDIFVFDGNEGGGAGIAEMLIQSHEEYIEFLPCLPKQWQTGYFKGLCVRGGAEVDLKWENEKLLTAKIKATVNNTFKFKLSNIISLPQFSINGKTTQVQLQKGLVQFDLKKGDVITFNY